MQYTFQLNDGGYARFLAGESYHLSGDNIYLRPGRDDNGNFLYTPFSGLETDRSDYVLGAYLAPIDAFRVISQSRFDRSTFALKREDITMVATYGPLTAQAGYSYDADAWVVPTPADPANPALAVLTRQQEFLGQITLRLTDRWSVGGTARYDLDKSEFLYDSVDLKYADECFVLTTSYIEANYTDATIKPRSHRDGPLRVQAPGRLRGENRCAGLQLRR